MYIELIKNNYLNNLFKKLLIFNEKDFNNSKIKIFFDKELKKKDSSCCFLEIFPNAGGIETQQIIKLFTDFYLKWFKKNLFNVELINYEISEFGYKKSLIYINDKFSFFLINNESGIHRIIRKNPLISNNKIQTSYININILPEIFNIETEIKKNDLIIETFKAKGPGGQHVNNTNSAVRITHIPSNIIVSCQSERSQIKNKNFAMKILNYKILLKKKSNIIKYLSFFNKKKYIKTYYFENNFIVNHLNNKKYKLDNFFKFNINFLKI